MKQGIGILLILGLFFISGGMKGQEVSDDITDYFNLSLEELMNMEIVAVSKKAESSFDAPLASSIITREEIINSGATTIEEVFRLVPGFIVREESNGNYDIHVRGNDNVPPGNFSFFSENTMSLVMIDGRKVFNNMNGGTFWETLPVSVTDVERIEVIRGASTALYGPNAVSGVINIITKKSTDERVSVDGNVQVGNAKTTIADLGVNMTSANEKLQTRISGNFEQRDRFETDYYAWVNGEYGHYSELVDYLNDNDVEVGSSKYADQELAKKRNGVNGWMQYDFNEHVSWSVYGGYQKSQAQVVSIETSLSQLSFRESESFNFNTQAQIHGLSVQFSGNSGTQDIYKGSEGIWKYDMRNLDAVIEYDWSLGDITLRPGMSYQHSVYSDLPYTKGESEGMGYLNDEVTLTNFAYYLRGDYRVSEKLRLIAALRMDHYNKPADAYFTYQVIGTYKPNDKNLFRASYARANRGPVMVDYYSDYNSWSTEKDYYLQAVGNENMDLPTSDVWEVGYRGQLSERFQLDVEGFYNSTQDFTSFEPTVDLSQGFVHVVYQYQNISVKAKQLGATASMLYAPTKKLKLRAWATVQKTELKDFAKKEVPMIVYPDAGQFENPVYVQVDETHEQTPAFFGGVSANYRPMDKLNIFTSLNFVSEQTYQHDYEYSQYHFFASQMNPDYTGSGVAQVSAKAIVNAKVSYKLYKNSSVFVNMRNALGSESPEFGFADHTKGLYLVGLNINL